ncbi:MAG TPA: hypothetical protein VFE91_02915 [Nitrososphaerales archaeon]|nr:hypothetical protein [Nitrososphaerales archaeon]
MKKTHVAAVAIAAAVVIALAATVAYLQISPSQSGTSGQLSIMGVDPPISASGVSDSSIHYNSVYAHPAGSDMSSGWVQVAGSGNFDLMAGQGTAQTIATSQVNAAAYDAFKINVDSAKVTYQGQQYVATVASTTLTAQSQSKVQVNDSAKAAAVVDLRSFIMNTGNSSQPQFVFSATAVATAVPPQALLSLSLQLGGTADLSGNAWWSTFMTQTSTDVSSDVVLTATSVSVNLHNTGSASAEAQEVIVTPVSASLTGSATLPSSLSGSAVFTVGGSGSLQQTTSVQSAYLLTGGTTMSAGSSANLQFTGTIALNFGQGTLHISGIIPGQQYLVTVIGANTYTSAVVVAS